MKHIGIGVIGCGFMGMDLVRRLLKVDPRLKVVALYDPESKAIENARQGLDPAPIICSDYPTLVNHPEVEWVMIASWNAFHAEQAIAAFKAGKHVFCQKPLATNLSDCVAMLDVWKTSGKLFNIGFTLRYSPHYRTIHRLIADGVIGEILSMEFNETLEFNHGGYIHGDWRRLRKNAGTHLLEKCCHDIDLANWMMNSRARRVASFGGTDFFVPQNERHMDRIGPHPDGPKAYRTNPGPIGLNPFTADKDIFDNQVAIIEYENRSRATFHTNANAGITERRMYIVGTEGALRADVLTGTIQTRRIGWGEPCIDHSTDVSGMHGGGDDVMARELADSMLNHHLPSASLMAGIESAITCFAIDEAADTGRVIDLGPLWNAAGLTERMV